MNAAAPGRVSTPARLTPGTRVGGITVTGPLRVTSMAEVYQAIQHQQGGAASGKLWMLYMGIYEALWGLQRGAIGRELSRAIPAQQRELKWEDREISQAQGHPEQE